MIRIKNKPFHFIFVWILILVSSQQVQAKSYTNKVPLKPLEGLRKPVMKVCSIDALLTLTSSDEQNCLSLSKKKGRFYFKQCKLEEDGSSKCYSLYDEDGFSYEDFISKIDIENYCMFESSQNCQAFRAFIKGLEVVEDFTQTSISKGKNAYVSVLLSSLVSITSFIWIAGLWVLKKSTTKIKSLLTAIPITSGAFAANNISDSFENLFDETGKKEKLPIVLQKILSLQNILNQISRDMESSDVDFLIEELGIILNSTDLFDSTPTLQPLSFNTRDLSFPIFI